jgi:signal transduction histidine kinase
VRASRLPLLYRIVLPLVAAALLSTGVATWVGVRLTSRALRARLESQLLSTASAVSSSSFALNVNILRNVRAVAGVDVVTLDPSGTVIASSLESDRVALIDAAHRIARGRSAGGQSTVVDEDCGFPCLVVWRPVDARPGAGVVLVADATPLASTTNAVVRAMLLTGALSVALLVIVSQAVVRRVTAPLERLVQFVRAASPQDAGSRAAVGDDEIGALAAAFNAMLDRLDESRLALVRSEKLGLAGLFAARVAHDIRNPLSSIKMQAQLLRSKLDPGTDDHDVLSAVLRDVAQVESVVRDLMDLANPGVLALQPGDLNAVLRGAIDQVSHQLTYRKIRIDLALTEPLPLIALDPQRLRQALLNVLVNASEAMHSGGELHVSTGVDGDTLRLRICDDGVGIDPALVGRVFDPFVSTKPEGVGLGLVNAKAVVEGHGGGIRLEPRPPRGTCAEIRLPISRHG